MPSKMKKKVFEYDQMAVKELYYNEEMQLPTEGVCHEVVKQVFGRDLMFGQVPEDRPYIYNSLVTSIDGRIAFLDKPQGPLIARNNKHAGAGGLLDYWILNVLRGASDAILVGTNSIAAEVNSGGTGHCYDENIELRREALGKDPIPWRVVVTLDGSDVEFKAAQFTNLDMSTFFYTTAHGVDYIKEHSPKEVVTIDETWLQGSHEESEFCYDASKAYVLVTNDDRSFDNEKGLKLLRRIGVKTLLVESPTITHVFMAQGLMDELFLNQSGLYIGGKAMTIGESCQAFGAEAHPHSELVSLYMHSPHFIYARYKMLYD